MTTMGALPHVRLGRSGPKTGWLLIGNIAFCGLRFGDICGLTLANIGFERRAIKVRHNSTDWDELKDPKTRTGFRTVPVPKHVLAIILDWVREHMSPEPHGLVPRTSDGGRLRSGNFSTQAWRPLLSRAKVLSDDKPYHFHALRHFAASWMIENGLPPTEVAALRFAELVGDLFPQE